MLLNIRLTSLAAACCIVLTAVVGAQVISAEDDAAEPNTDFKALKSPVAYTSESIKRGKTLYVRMCTECHGPDGKALMDVIADATDLTSPKLWLSGTTEGEIFRSILDGAGVSMPPYKTQIRREEDMWHLVNFVRSLWPESVRPQLQQKEDSSKTDTDPDNAKNGG